jgi:hypothetical protein
MDRRKNLRQRNYLHLLQCLLFTVSPWRGIQFHYHVCNNSHHNPHQHAINHCQWHFVHSCTYEYQLPDTTRDPHSDR